MRIIETVLVPAELAGQRTDRAAAVLFPDYSRSNLVRWLKDGGLTLDGARVKANHKVMGGEQLYLDVESGAEAAWDAAQTVEFSVLYEDDHLLVVDKPAHVVVHPGAGNPDHTLVNGLIAHREALKHLPRAGIVHRLDKDTSGVMVVAASLAAHRHLVDAIQNREVQRGYLAVAEGRMVSGLDIDRPIGRDPRQRTRQAVREDGKPALTHVRVQERFRVHTLIKAALATGRTHQIRVHLASIGHPLVGDRRYGARGLLPRGGSSAFVERVRAFPRQALHAHSLSFDHPASGKTLDFSAPVPDDLQGLIDALREDADGAR
ncbi:MAG: 23S rRNA pseudouridine(1911/1915/1917) synthase RluD [Pseudomonadales bacterium]|jgi:23S rRNA pseudouridine1911/1915/1917 synthase|nr:23S rRNA pseudouridine(1911/1915/1917) synthase RluD [Pseudomonadales bacterium]MDP6471588.1 23S rRNA pseudouridine(1911/1915/1917) synthase RluD [Pseudomonadales bacterium]MDP6828851.1 23S rRNA pseudouridine(1911/1915/1917) synthase RluD [Pseudomonadales bacterium]MDP6971707.1 23S rRNA pseudouridine(1911/1915/1917) synthase RluD [Pseudomonadales bacterium]|tara:strand:- start:64 stop:1020 length:957 start_codon:yes stop_codon:yes gene_type:complete